MKTISTYIAEESGQFKFNGEYLRPVNTDIIKHFSHSESHKSQCYIIPTSKHNGKALQIGGHEYTLQELANYLKVDLDNVIEKMYKNDRKSYSQYMKEKIEYHYFYERGIKKELLKDWFILEETRGNKPYSNCVITTYIRNELKNYQKISSIKNYKRLNFKGTITETLFIGKEWREYKYKSLYICEGVPDALSLLSAGFNAISVRSKNINKLTREQLLEFVRENEIKNIIIVPDSDAKEEWKDIFSKLFKSIDIIDVSSYDKNINIKDVNDLLVKVCEKDLEKFKNIINDIYEKYKDAKQDQVNVIEEGIGKLLKQKGLEYYTDSKNYYKINNNQKTIFVHSSIETTIKYIYFDIKNWLKDHHFDKQTLKRLAEEFICSISTTDNLIHGLTITKSKERVVTREHNRKYLNLFSGFSIEYDDNNKAVTEDLLKDNHIYILIKKLMNNNEEYIKYLLNFFSYKIFSDYEDRQLGKVLIFHSDRQGIGKGSLMEFFRTILKDHFIQVFQEELDSSFNSYLEHALICFYDEVKLTEDNYKKIKGLTTSKEIVINEKGVKQYTRTNNIMYVVASNTNKFKISKEDRRCIMFDCGTSLKNNFHFFKEYNDNLYENSIQFFQYLKYLWETSNRDKMYIYLEKGLETSYKKEIIELNYNSVENFFNDLFIEDDLKEKIYENLIDRNDNYYIPTKDIYEIYKQYCTDSNVKAFGKKTFNSMLNKEYENYFNYPCYDKITRIKIDGKTLNTMDFTEYRNKQEKIINIHNVDQKEKQVFTMIKEKKMEEADKLIYKIEDFYLNLSDKELGNSKLSIFKNIINVIKNENY